MKKILAVVLALTMIVGMSIPAFAVETEIKSVTENNTKSFPVEATYTFNGNDAPVYGVNVTWTAISFEYVVGQGAWNPENLAYNENASAAWIDASQTTTITVTNYSNVAIVATATWTEGAVEADVDLGDAITVASALNEDAAPSAKTGTIDVTVDVTGKTIAKDETVGTIVVTITAAPQ